MSSCVKFRSYYDPERVARMHGTVSAREHGWSWIAETNYLTYYEGTVQVCGCTRQDAIDKLTRKVRAEVKRIDNRDRSMQRGTFTV